MAQVKLKDESERIVFGGKHEEINASNLTFEKYQWVVNKFPYLSDKFEVIEDVIVSDKKSKADK